MAVIVFRSPVNVPLHRSEWVRPAGNTDFRVTQQFNSPDFYWKNIDPAKAALGHRATDIGNARCGWPIVAMAAGTATRLKDNATNLGAPTDALGIKIDHGSGITTEYWHLDSYSIANGALVKPGTEIGKVGKTGLGQVCHCHIEGKRNGIKFDPEPLMFGGSINTTEITEEFDMRFGGAELKILDGARDEFALTASSHFRAGPTRQSTSLQIFPAGTIFYATVSVDGELIGSNDQWVPTFQYVGSAYVLGFYHASVIQRKASPVVGGLTQADIDKAVTATTLERNTVINALGDKIRNSQGHMVTAQAELRAAQAAFE
jgi:hypothetical protein